MRPLRVVLDTNVLLSAVLFSGPPRRVLELVISGRAVCVLSEAILDELREVLQRAKFGYSVEQAYAVVEELRGASEQVRPSVKVNAIKEDPDDNNILAYAVKGRADVIVSGDGDLLRLGRFRDISILSPRDFLTFIEARNLAGEGCARP